MPALTARGAADSGASRGLLRGADHFRLIRRARALAPAQDHRSVVLIAERAQGAGGKREQGALPGLKPEPTGGEHAKHVAMAEDHHVAVGGAGLGDHAVGPRAHVRSRFPVGAAVAPLAPSGAPVLDLGRRVALALAFVPLSEDAAALGRRPQAFEVTGFA